jgi:hypothetical protein
MRMRRWIYVVAPLAIAAFIIIGGEAVLHLWNWLLPALFGWRMITFLQALGLLALCRILFGGLGHGGGPRSNIRGRMKEKWQQRWAERWEKMTPEEREKIGRVMRAPCGFGEPAAGTPGEAKP